VIETEEKVQEAVFVGVNYLVENCYTLINPYWEVKD